MIKIDCIKDNRVVFTKEIENKISSITSLYGYLSLIGMEKTKIKAPGFEADVDVNSTKQKLAEISLDIESSYSGLIDEDAISERIDRSSSHVKAAMSTERMNPSLLGNRSPSDFAKEYNRLLSF